MSDITLVVDHRLFHYKIIITTKAASELLTLYGVWLWRCIFLKKAHDVVFTPAIYGKLVQY